ncbi:MAG TPA: L-2-hydroxyglutarate oxidase [Thiolinea sp.]|nr:L-2-hydroxyglutarate oxidase [Thiolinea sp.]
MSIEYDYIIIGGGIVGVSTAWQLKQRHPDKRILLLEKESELARHQTGHNSGVIHAGVYYQPGSLKARFCREGSQATMAFCREHGIPYEQCGKLLVATSPLELERLQALFERCRQNGIEAERLDQKGLKQLEPQIAGLGAIRVPATGIVNYRLVTEKMAQAFVQLGGEIRLRHQVTDLNELRAMVELTVTSPEGMHPLEARFLIVCGGLQADRFTHMMGLPLDFRIIPFRGEYYRLARRRQDMTRHLIYPVPDPELPFLGVHLTRMIDGSLTAGPNAVLGYRREGYGRFNFSPVDTLDMLRFPGFWQVMRRHLRTGLQETLNAWWKPGYLEQVRKYAPQIGLRDLKPWPAGIRAQAILRDGTLVHDFLFAESPRSLHVCNAPSPAATSAIPIGQYICEKAEAANPD